MCMCVGVAKGYGQYTDAGQVPVHAEGNFCIGDAELTGRGDTSSCPKKSLLKCDESNPNVECRCTWRPGYLFSPICYGQLTLTTISGYKCAISAAQS